jgi:hypothetical protein
MGNDVDQALPRSGLSRTGRIALVPALVYAAAIVAAGFTLPVYSEQSVSSSGAVTNGSATLVAVNGTDVLLVLAIPLVVTCGVALALWPVVRRGGLPLAWTLTGILVLFTLLAMLSIGVFVLPVTLALVITCATCRPRAKTPGPVRDVSRSAQ